MMLFAFTLNQSYSQVNLDSGLVGYFKLNSSTADSSVSLINGTGTDLTPSNGVTCDSNTAFSFNGTSSKMVCDTSNRGITHTVSISAWVKTTVSTGHLFIVEKYDWVVDKGYYLALKNGVPLMGARNTSNAGKHTWTANQTFFVSDGNWHHLLGVVSQNNIEIWVDGVLKSSNSLSAANPVLTNTYNLSIGYYFKGSSTGNLNYFNGSLDEIRIYNRDLSFTEIDSLQKFRNSYESISVTVCDSLISPSGKTVWTNSGIYQDTVLTSCSGDSIYTVNLAVLNSQQIVLNESSCGSYTSPSGSYSWDSSGVYYDTLSTSLGCDSVLKINLTVSQSASTAIKVNSCDSYLWLVNGVTYNNSGVFTDTLLTVAGCDSIVQLDLSVLSSSAVTLLETTCSIYTAPDGVSYTSSGQYQAIISNRNGCDSVITINLTVNQTNTSITRVGTELHAVSDSNYMYQWVNCDNGNTSISGANDSVFSPLVSGNYSVEIENGNCLEMSLCTSVLNVDVTESLLNTVQLYPNPVENVLYVSNPNAENILLSITDVTGRNCYQEQVRGRNNQVDMSGFSPGIYLVSIKSKGLNRVAKVLVK
jgi:hypothetical protein